MCISLLTTSHPSFPFILISNRDELLARPTAPADWWDVPNHHVLGGRDLQSDERGTWLGITKQGRIAILTNFREEGDHAVNRAKSRGAIVNSYLCLPPHSELTEEEHAQNLTQDGGLDDVGGFTMLFGRLRKPRADGSLPGLAIVSNRTQNSERLTRIATSSGETHGISNSHYGDRSWQKVVDGEKYLSEAVRTHASSSPEDLITALFAILSTDTLPSRKINESWDMYKGHMRNSILIPPAKGQAPGEFPGKGAYGTSIQTVMLVNEKGEVTLVERKLFEWDGSPIAEGKWDIKRDFQIERWDDA